MAASGRICAGLMGRVWSLLAEGSGSKSIWIQGPNCIFLIRVKPGAQQRALGFIRNTGVLWEGAQGWRRKRGCGNGYWDSPVEDCFRCLVFMDPISKQWWLTPTQDTFGETSPIILLQYFSGSASKNTAQQPSHRNNKYVE